MMPKLVPLRISSGWNINYNILYEVNSSILIENSLYLKESLLTLSNTRRKRVIDIGWYPEERIDGEYCLVMLRLEDPGYLGLGYWNGDAISLFRTRDLNQLVEKIEELVYEVTEGNL